MSSVEEMLAHLLKQVKNFNSKLDAAHCEMMSQMKEFSKGVHEAIVGQGEFEVNAEIPKGVENEKEGSKNDLSISMLPSKELEVHAETPKEVEEKSEVKGEDEDNCEPLIHMPPPEEMEEELIPNEKGAHEDEKKEVVEKEEDKTEFYMPPLEEGGKEDDESEPFISMPLMEELDVEAKEEKEIGKERVLITIEEVEIVPNGKFIVEPNGEFQQENDAYRVENLEENGALLPNKKSEPMVIKGGEGNEAESGGPTTNDELLNLIIRCVLKHGRFNITKISRYKNHDESLLCGDFLGKAIDHLPFPFRHHASKEERLMAQPFEGGGNDMESMSWPFMNSKINRVSKSTKTIKRFLSAINDLLEINDVGDDSIFNLASQLINENEVWMVAWRLEDLGTRLKARNEGERSNKSGEDTILPALADEPRSFFSRVRTAGIPGSTSFSTAALPRFSVERARAAQVAAIASCLSRGLSPVLRGTREDREDSCLRHCMACAEFARSAASARGPRSCCGC